MNKITKLSILVAVAAILYVAVPFALWCNYPCNMKCAVFDKYPYPLDCYDRCGCGFLIRYIAPKKTVASHAVVHTTTQYQDSAEDCPLGQAPPPKIQMKPQYLASESAPKQPNIILFLFDDLDELVSPYFEAMPFSKQLFLQNGTRYTNAFAQTSICCPARCQILTGLMGHNTGVLENHGRHGGNEGFVKPYWKNSRMKDSEGRCINNEYRTVPFFLSTTAKYKTFIGGKYMNGIETPKGSLDHVPPGWSEIAMSSNPQFVTGFNYALGIWKEGDTQVEYKMHGFDEASYSTDVVARRTVQFIDNERQPGKAKSPLFAYVCPTAPHFPIQGPPRYHDKNYYWEAKYDQYVSNRPNYYNVTEIEASKSRWLKESIPWRSQTEWILRVEFAKRMSSLYALDDMIKTVYDKIAAINELDNTIFVMASDNGYNMGAHMLLHKMSPYDEGSKVPLYISGPGFGRGKVVEDLVLLTDLAPTSLDISGLQVPEYLDSVSLLSGHKRDVIFLHYKEEEDPISHTIRAHENETVMAAMVSPPGFAQDLVPWKAIRTHNLAYICYYSLSYASYATTSNADLGDFTEDKVDVTKLERECELYNLKKDPYQMNNILKEVDAAVVAKLDAALEALSQCSGKSCYNYKLQIQLP